MKKIAIPLIAVITAICACFIVAGCNDDGNKEGCYIDEKSAEFAGGYYATVTDVNYYDVADIGGIDYPSEYEGGKFVAIDITIERDSDSEDVTFTANWFTLKNGDVSVTPYMQDDIIVNTVESNLTTLYFDLETVSEKLELVIANPQNGEDCVTITLSARK